MMALWSAALCAAAPNAGAAGSGASGGDTDAQGGVKLETTTRVVERADPPSKKFEPKEGEFRNAEELLTALETAGNGMKTFAAEISYARKLSEIEGGETQERTGRLVFDQTPPSGDEKLPLRRFRVDFEKLRVDNRVRDERQSFIFDGQWLAEVRPVEKQVMRRRVVKDGKRFDPLAIGEGPFPIPIGQKKSKILERFEAELVHPEDGWGDVSTAKFPSEALADTYQLKLTPREGTAEHRQYETVRVWYIKDSLLPRMAWTDERNGESTEVFLRGMRLDEALEGGETVFDTKPPPGYDEVIAEYEQGGRE